MLIDAIPGPAAFKAPAATAAETAAGAEAAAPVTAMEADSGPTVWAAPVTPAKLTVVPGPVTMLVAKSRTISWAWASCVNKPSQASQLDLEAEISSLGTTLIAKSDPLTPQVAVGVLTV